MSVVPVFDITAALPQGTTLLEASAGTGKTWTIAALVTRYVAEDVARLDQMLIVTFGRAASQELRERVRAQLVEAERVLSDPAQDDGRSALLTLLLDVDEDERRARRDRLRDALVDFDAATIATTHQFCQQVLRGLGVAGDTDPGSHLVEDLDDLLVEVVDDLYVRGFASAAEPPVFDRRAALAIARAAVGDPQARLEPEGADRSTPAGRRYGFARAVREELEVRKRRLGLLSYDDLLSRLAEALADPDAPARQRMRQRWQVVLVDEFQDTDPVQWAVLDRAFNGHATMVLIGDPKQAIYAFRGGDVVTYLAAETTADTKATLGTNHRSDPALLDAVHALLAGAVLGDERITVHELGSVHPGGRLHGAPHASPFRLRVVDQARFGVTGSGGVTIGPLRAAVAEDLASDVRALLGSGATFEGQPLLPGQVAVLCETRRQCETVRAALARAGVPAVVGGSGTVYDSQGADEWLCLLEAMEQPHRSARVRAAALTSFFGHTAEELDASRRASQDATGTHADRDPLTDAVADTLRSWGQVLRDRGVAAVFELAFRGGRLAARVLTQEQGERLMTDLRHVAETLHAVAGREQLALPGLLAWLRTQIAEVRNDPSGERTRRLDSDAAAVQILTIHGSKGLQYPVVYLPYVSDHFPRPPDFPLFHDDAGHRRLDVGGSGSSPDFRKRAMVEEAGEDLRLLYVALTRAQSQLVVWWMPSSKNTGTSSLHRLLYGRGPGDPVVPPRVGLPTDEQALAHAQRWQQAGAASVEVLQSQQAAVPTSAPPSRALAARSWTRYVDPVWRRTSYSALSAAGGDHAPAGVASEPERAPRDDEPELPTPAARTHSDAASVPSPMADLPVGATFGSLVHAVLEHADPAAPDHGGDLHAELAEHIGRQLVRWPVPLDADQRDALATALVAVCDTPLGPLAAGATLRTIGRAGRMCELDFELPLAGGDDLAYPATRHRLAGLAPLLREHLAPGDPLLPYADVLDLSVGTGGPADEWLQGYLTGSVDVVLRVGERFLVVDYKTNWLGSPPDPVTGQAPLTAHDYRPEALAAAMTHSSYPLQALLYAVVLHRFLRWRLAGYDPEAHLGGVLYLYLRGLCGPDTPVVDGQPCGVFAWRPPVALVEAVSDLLDGATAAGEVA